MLSVILTFSLTSYLSVEDVCALRGINLRNWFIRMEGTTLQCGHHVISVSTHSHDVMSPKVLKNSCLIKKPICLLIRSAVKSYGVSI
jgi:hypothetical protein